MQRRSLATYQGDSDGVITGSEMRSQQCLSEGVFGARNMFRE